MSILVVYYSRSGTTEKIARVLAEKLEADLEEIVSKNKRKGLIGYLRSGQEAAQKKLTEINKSEKNPSDYDLVIIGTPVWVGTMSSPVRSYLNHYLGKFRKVAFFSTQGSKKEQKVFKELIEVLGKEPVAKIFLTTKEVAQDNFSSSLDEFIKEVKKS